MLLFKGLFRIAVLTLLLPWRNPSTFTFLLARNLNKIVWFVILKLKKFELLNLFLPFDIFWFFYSSFLKYSCHLCVSRFNILWNRSFWWWSFVISSSWIIEFSRRIRLWSWFKSSRFWLIIVMLPLILYSSYSWALSHSFVGVVSPFTIWLWFASTTFVLLSPLPLTKFWASSFSRPWPWHMISIYFQNSFSALLYP